MAQVYSFVDENGATRLFAEIHPDPAGTPFNGGTITTALDVAVPTGNPTLTVVGGGDPVADGNLIVAFEAGNVGHTSCFRSYSDGTCVIDLDAVSPGEFRVGANLVRMVGDGTIGFYGHAPVALQTGVAVTAAGIHAALVSLGLITA